MIIKNYISKKVAAVTTFFTTLMISTTSFAIDVKTASDLNAKIENIINQYILPLAGSLIFASVVGTGILIIVRAHRPKERAETMSGLLWVCIGAGVLGLGALIAGLILGATKG